MRKTLLATVALWPMAALGQSQANLDAIAAATWNQVMGDQVPECALNGSGPPVKGAGTCVPLTLAPGDVLPGSNQSLTDKNGNTWSLSCAPGEDGNGCWYGGMVFNGKLVDNGYWFALRLVNGIVYAEQAKGAGWTITDASNPGDFGNFWAYTPGGGQSPEQRTGGGGQAVAAPVAASAQTPTPTEASAPATSCAGGLAANAITSGSGSFTDAGGNTYAIDTNENTATINGVAITPNGESSQTRQMVTVSGQVYGQDQNTLQWFELTAGPGGERPWAWQPVEALPTGNQAPVATARLTTPQPCASTLAAVTPPDATVPADQPVTPLPAATPDQVNNNSKCGNFTDANGQIIGPNGQPFTAKGVDIWAQQVINGDPNTLANQITSMFPGVNIVRVAAGDGYATDSAAALEPFVLAMTAKGIVVEICDYNPQYTQSVPTGAGLQEETQWFQSLASTFLGDPYVWFSTANEPSDTYSGATATEQQAVYSAVRGTGSNAMVGLENTQWPGGSSASINPGEYASMNNVFLDVHYYNWLSGYSTSVSANATALRAEVKASQAAYGNFPVIIGEYGTSTTGDGTDPGGMATVSAVTQSPYGWTAWGINSGGTGDQLTNGGNGLTSYGQAVAAAATTAQTAVCQSLPTATAAAPQSHAVTPVTSLGPALSLAGGTTTPGTIAPANTIGGNQ
jgi:hypothetical protein